MWQNTPQRRSAHPTSRALKQVCNVRTTAITYPLTVEPACPPLLVLIKLVAATSRTAIATKKETVLAATVPALPAWPRRKMQPLVAGVVTMYVYMLSIHRSNEPTKWNHLS